MMRLTSVSGGAGLWLHATAKITEDLPALVISGSWQVRRQPYLGVRGERVPSSL